MNWKKFAIKNENKEQLAFEQMAYLLFCSEFGNSIGLFRYHNQTGIETEPLEKEGKLYGFSAKYYEVSINERKKEIIEAITKAKNKNPELDTIHFYVNQELSESSKTDRKKAKYEIEIDDACKELGVSLEWRVPSHFELQLALPKNKYIHDLFFSLAPTLDMLRDNVFEHNTSILRAIRTEISVDGKKIKIDRKNYISKIQQFALKGEHIILSGEGGSGKTAVVKEFYQQYSADIPICIFKATELNINHFSDLFRFEHNFSVADFFNTYESESNKIFVIDSAEKLAELSNQTVLNDLIDSLIKYGWTIVFTTRTSYLDDLRYHINESYQLSCTTLEIQLLATDELNKLSLDYEIKLPSNSNFKDRLRNLFYLNEYINHYQGSASNGNFSSFIELLWKRKIQNDFHKKDNLHVQRGRCLEYIAKERADTNRFYIAGEGLSQDALYQLKIDDILGYDEQHDGYFITHDIYEEWALNHIIDKVYISHISIEEFFSKLGESLAIRRAFRLWLSQKLVEDEGDNIKDFIHDIFISDISQFWKDELLVSVLLSEYSFEFFRIFENELRASEFAILKRIIFLLKVACKDVVGASQIAKPKGKGWQATISFISQYQSDFLFNNMNVVVPILLEWCTNNTKGNTTYQAGSLAIAILYKQAEGDMVYRSDTAESIFKIVFESCHEIKDDITKIFDLVLEHNLTENNQPFQDFCVTILTKCYLAVKLIQLLPESIIKLCKLFWFENKGKSSYTSGSFDINPEMKFGLKKYEFECFPASAHQTPIYWLLNTKNFYETINFIVLFVNQAIDNYAQLEQGKNNLREVIIFTRNKSVKQWHSFALWTMYRGHGNPTMPYLLQSIHMALEKFLLEIIKIEGMDIRVVEAMLLQILDKSTSTSLTSVVCSIVLANPNKLYRIALMLFKTVDLFHCDLMRSNTESQAKSLYSIGYGLGGYITNTLYRDERLRTCKDEHRKLNLESLCLHYQFYGVKDFTEEQNADFIQNIFEIIDEHKSNLNGKDDAQGILLARMDRRNLEPEVVEDEETTKVFLKPKLTEEQRAISENAQTEYDERFKYTALQLWSDLFDTKKYDSSNKYDDNPLLALEDTKKLLKELKQGSGDIFDTFNRNTVYSSCAKLIIEHSDLLTDNDKLFCRDIIRQSIARLFQANYDYQISDGLEYCIHAIPKLLELYSTEDDELYLLLVFILFDKQSIGMYKRVCDYVIEAIQQRKVWNNNPGVANQIINAFILLKPVYDEAVTLLEQSDNSIYKRDISKSKAFKKFLELCEDREIDASLDNINVDTSKLDSLNIDDIETLYLLLPNNTTDRFHLAVLDRTLPGIAKLVLKDRGETREIQDAYRLKQNISKKISEVMLYRQDNNEIESLLKPILTQFKRNDETESFIEKFICSENERYKPDNFWYIWKLIYPRVIKLYEDNSYYHDFDKLINNYLLAWGYWKEGIKEWRSLTKDNLWLYSNISKDLGHQPSVLYSISKVLNSIASNFHDEGVDWVNTIVVNHPKLKLGEVESNTLFYLENYLRQYVFLNRQSIKQNVRLKNKVISILDFMVERGSVHGYQLREGVL